MPIPVGGPVDLERSGLERSCELDLLKPGEGERDEEGVALEDVLNDGGLKRPPNRLGGWPISVASTRCVMRPYEFRSKPAIVEGTTKLKSNLVATVGCKTWAV
jgi:hypothetical protein